MSSDIAISVKNLTKTYRIFNHAGDRIKQALTFGRVKYHREFTALNDVSFEIKKGETVGIIGRNGSGKSTLLQLICGILKPTSGSVTVNGRISALLELGSGFNPEFTGRENIYFQGAIMGFSKEGMASKVEGIIAFADIGEFIDQPVRTYSSGMFVRLAFATAVHVDPDILVIDEALAVGDMDFQQKSFAHLTQMLAHKQVTVLLVSHDLRQVQRFCSQGLYLEKGVPYFWGESSLACQKYYEATLKDAQRLHVKSVETSSGEIELIDIEILDTDDPETPEIASGDPLHIRLFIKVNSYMERPEFIVGTESSEATFLSTSSTAEFGIKKDLKIGRHTIDYKIDEYLLAPGEYYIRMNVRDQHFRLLYTGEFLKAFRVKPDSNGATRPMRLLNLKTKMLINGNHLSNA